MFRFGPFEIDPARRTVRRDTRELAIGARAFDLLVALVERRDRVVGKNELLDCVWPGAFVEEGNLAVQVSTLRKLLGARSIATVPGRGYRFVAALDAVARVVPSEGGQRPEFGMHAAPRFPNLHPASSPDDAPLFGRDADLAAVRTLLVRHRLVTLCGGSGFGKSALGLNIAAQLYREGAFEATWTVQLAPVDDPDRVATSVAGVLQVEHGGDLVSEAIGRALQHMQGLLLIDNCEHVADAVTALAAVLLDKVPGLTILVTSQVPLKLAAERVYRLGGLAIPVEPEVRGALALFEARVRIARSSFALGGSEWAGAAEICRRLDGNPLAIELAAARVPLLGVEGVRSRLDERFRLLRRDPRFSASRHETLHEAIRWSAEFLSPQDQAVFRRLAVFAGSFGLVEAQRVAADISTDEWDVLDRLGTLVERSLVSVEPGLVPRYRLLETVRIYAAERLAAAGETEDMRARHAEALAAAFALLDDRRWEMTSEQIYSLLYPEIDNLRSALAWAREAQGRATLALGLAARAMWLWDAANITAEGSAQLAYFDQAAARERLAPSMRALFWSARTFDSSGVDPNGPTALDSSVAVACNAIGEACDSKERRFLYDALTRAAIHDARAGRVEGARERVQLARSLEEQQWPPRKLAMRWFAESELAEAEDRLADAYSAQYTRARLACLAGEEAAQLHAAALLVAFLVGMDRIDSALESATEAMASISSDLPAHRTRSLRVSWADALVAAGRPAEAAAKLAPALSLYEDSASQWSLLDSLAYLCAAGGDMRVAAQTITVADRAYDGRGFVRKPHLHRARERLATALAVALPVDELAKMQALGSALSETQAIHLGANAVTLIRTDLP
ncbi:MAG: winged helix-turn-helix domain-containing protein [Anaerolineaceae bacterium]